MSLYTLPNETTNIDKLLVDTVAQVSMLNYLLLFFVFFIVWLGGVGRQKARTGTSDYALWSVIASLCTFLTALVLTMRDGFIDLGTLGIVVSITILSGLWLFLDRKSGEI